MNGRVAEGEGFEPPDRSPDLSLSRRVHSAGLCQPSKIVAPQVSRLYRPLFETRNSRPLESTTAEKGFEPLRRVTPPTRFPGMPFQPLRHISKGRVYTRSDCHRLKADPSWDLRRGCQQSTQHGLFSLHGTTKEGMGFEPMDRVTPVSSFQDCHIHPLCQPSVTTTGPAGFEPATSPVTAERSATELQANEWMRQESNLRASG
jgi:hypothetical protein